MRKCDYLMFCLCFDKKGQHQQQYGQQQQYQGGGYNNQGGYNANQGYKYQGPY